MAGLSSLIGSSKNPKKMSKSLFLEARRYLVKSPTGLTRSSLVEIGQLWRREKKLAKYGEKRRSAGEDEKDGGKVAAKKEGAHA